MDTIRAVPMNLSDLISVHSMFQLLYACVDKYCQGNIYQHLIIFKLDSVAGILQGNYLKIWYAKFGKEFINYA